MTLLASLALALQPSSPPVVLAAPVEPVKWMAREERSPSCAMWLESLPGTNDHAQLRRAAWRMWAAGYVTGFNMHGPDPAGNLLDGAAGESLDPFLDEYCASHPTHFLVDAMRPLVNDAMARRGEPAPIPGTPAPERKQAMILLTVTCQKWTDARDDRILRLAYGLGVGGYLTAYNYWGPDPSGDAMGAFSDDSVDEWIDEWCNGRTNFLVSAVRPLIDHLAAERAAGRLPRAGMLPGDRLTPGTQESR